ncbi:DUF4189 domain-containing protein [Mycobacterium bourgelatii]|nr:DUF4189 domain-containing protein [Mycobacterium bourgelatii]MCV6975022.1 DUF4189 domain-containing protein [Mycobacterium bourgelatii]
MITKVRHRTIFVAAGLAVALGLGLLLLPAGDAHVHGGPVPAAVQTHAAGMPLPPLISYGAIAYAPTGQSGKAWRQPSPARAAQLALRQCGVKECAVLSRFTYCGAVAHDGARYQGGAGMTRSAAEADAIHQLAGGWIVNWVCN